MKDPRDRFGFVQHRDRIPHDLRELPGSLKGPCIHNGPGDFPGSWFFPEHPQHTSEIGFPPGIQDGIRVTNLLAPEHCEVMTRNPAQVAAKITTASLLNGDFTTDPCGLVARFVEDESAIRMVTHYDRITRDRWAWPPRNGELFAGPGELIRLL